jgi:hypothetical protein
VGRLQRERAWAAGDGNAIADPTVAATRLRKSAPTGLPDTLEAFRNYHAGATIIVCGCGQSLNELADPGQYITIGVNDVGRLFQPTYLVVLNGRSQFSGDRFRHVLQSDARAIFTQLDLGLNHPHIVRFNLGDRNGVSLDRPNMLPYAANSPYLAVCLAALMGAKRIGLIGVDFTEDHFFERTGKHPLEGQLAQIDRQYATLGAACQARGVELVNLSQKSRLTSLPRVSLDVWAKEEKPAPSPRILFVHYRFLSAGNIFEIGLREAAQTLSLESEHTYWDDAQLPQRLDHFQPDLLFVVHGRRFVQRWGNRFSAWRSAVWLVDEPYEVDDTRAWSSTFDTVFVNDLATVECHRNAHELPTAYAPVLHHVLPDHSPSYRVGFVGGTNPARERLLTSLAKRGLLDYVVGGPWSEPNLKALCLSANVPAERAAALYQDTAIVLNIFRERHHYNRTGISATSWNPRVCEALACGALVLSEPREALARWIPELPTFRNEHEARDLAEHFLSDPADRVRVSRAAAQRLRDATYAKRLETVLNVALPHRAMQGVPDRSSHSRCGSETHAGASKTAPHLAPVPAQAELPAQWIDCGGAASIKAAELIIAAPHDDFPGSERGLASESAFNEVELSFEAHLSADAVFLAKIHQQDRINQSTNSYHLFSGPDRSYLAMHHSFLAEVRLARDRWTVITLSWRGGVLRLICDGTPAATVAHSALPSGYCFVGVKGGRVRLRNLRAAVPNSGGQIDDGRRQTKSSLPAGWLAHGDAPEVTDDLIVLRASDNASAAETGIATIAPLTQTELTFQLKLPSGATFIAKIHQQDRGDPASNSYHLICGESQDYIAKHNVVFRQLRVARDLWQTIVFRRTENAWVELFVNGVSVAAVLDNQLQSGFCSLGVGRGHAVLRNVKLRDLASDAISILPGAVAIEHTAKGRIRFSRVPRRNLLYHIWPVKGRTWRWNLEQLIGRIDIFNGRRIVGIVHDHRSENPDAVMEALDGHGCEFVIQPNDSRGEAVTFPHLLSRISSTDPDEVTFYGHGKGVKYEPNFPDPVRRWTEVLYRTALDNWSEVKRQLECHALTGPFRIPGRFRAHRNLGSWHYCGTFFWLRHIDVFTRGLEVPQFYGGVEVWPGLHFTQLDTGCLFMDQLRQLPYHADFWRTQGEPAFARWETDRQGVPPPTDLIEPVPFDGHPWPKVEQRPEELRWWIQVLLQAGIQRLLTIGAKYGGVEWHIARIFREHGRHIDITSIELAPTPELRDAFADATQRFHQRLTLVVGDSASDATKAQLNTKYDAVFIDGDHSYRGVRSDWLLAQSLQARLVGLHDIIDSDWHVQSLCCVSRLWRQIQTAHQTETRSGDIWGGIGVVRL